MSKTEIRFVSGLEPNLYVPRRAKTLTHRFAVIQETYRPNSADLFFDEALWLRLVDFAKAYAPSASVTVVDDDTDTTNDPDIFLKRWRAQAAEDREPAAIAVHDRGRLVLYFEPEFWVRAGGPSPYHDSYTHALYSNEDIAGRVMAYLAQADAAQNWDLSGEILSPSPALPFWKRVWQRFS